MNRVSIGQSPPPGTKIPPRPGQPSTQAPSRFRPTGADRFKKTPPIFTTSPATGSGPGGPVVPTTPAAGDSGAPVTPTAGTSKLRELGVALALLAPAWIPLLVLSLPIHRRSRG